MNSKLKLMVAGMVAAGIATTVAAREYRSSDVHPEDYPTVMAVKFMSDQIKAKTGGKDSIKVYTMSQLGGEKDTIEQTKIGALDFVRINVAPMNNICPETMVPTMPFLFKSKEHMRKVLDGPIGDEILKACEKQGFIGLAFYDSGSRSLYTTKKPIKTLADVKGMKIRVQQSDLWVALLQAMGANATPMPYGEVYTALKTGVVDGAENNWPSYDTSRHFEVAKYYSITEHSMAPEMLLMSKKVWDTLTPAGADRSSATRPRRRCPTCASCGTRRNSNRARWSRPAARRSIEVDKKSFQDAMKPVYDKFITDPKMKDMVSKIQASN